MNEVREREREVNETEFGGKAYLPKHEQAGYLLQISNDKYLRLSLCVCVRV